VILVIVRRISRRICGQQLKDAGTLVANLAVELRSSGILKEVLSVSRKVFLWGLLAALAVTIAGCAKTDEMANANMAPTTRTAPDNSEVMTMIDENGTKTETRVFRNNPRVSRVVVTTTKDGRRTTRVYSPSGQEKVVDNVGDALEATGDKLADAAGWVADKSEDAVGEAGDKLEDVGDKTAEGAKKVGEKTVEGAKTVGSKTAKGAKKVGGTIKDAVTP
jgi:hypothetical protein